MNSRLKVRLIRRQTPKPGTWGPQADPVDPMETWTRMRAQSLLCGLKFRDGSSQAPPLTLDQARDVLRWTDTKLPA